MATVRLQLRRGTEAQWDSANPTLAAGEIGIETDTNTFKFGDGSTAWNSLSYALSQTVDDYILLSTKGVANGVASLDSSGFIPSAQLPPLAKVTVSSAANQAARLALTAEPGDIAIQADNGTTYVLASSPASTNGNWREISATAAISAAVATHEADTTSVHGIADTSLLATTANVATAKSEAISAAASAAGTALSTHEADTTSVHGIADTSILATTTGTQTLTNKTLTSPVINTPTGITKSDVGLSNVDNTTDALKPVSTATAAAIATAKTQAESYADAAVSILTTASPEALNTLNELAAALGDDANFAGTVTSSLALKAPLASPTFTGTVTLPVGTVTSGMILDGSVTSSKIANGTIIDSDINAAAEISTSKISGLDIALGLRAPLAAPTFTGTVTLPATTSIGDVSNVELAYVNGVTSGIQGQIDAKLETTVAASTYAPLASPTLTGTVTLPATTSIGDVSNVEIGYVNGVTSGIQSQLDTKSPLAAPTFTGTVTLPATTSIGDVSNLEIGYLNGVTSGVQTQLDAKQAVVANVSDVEISYLDGVTSAIQTQLNTKQPVVANVSDVEIGHLDGVTSGIQGQIDLKAPLASPTFTGTVTLPALTVSSSMIAADAVTSGKIANGTIVNEDVSASAEIATSKISGLDTALGLKAPLASPTFTGTVTLPAGTITSGMILDGAIATADIADSAITSAKIADGTIMNADLNASAEIAQSKISGLSTSLGLKADLASPALTGIPVAPTAAAATNTTQIATTAYVRAEVAALVNSAGATLDTLGEIATALGNDASLSTTLTNAIALKAPLASPTFTGTNTVAALTASGLITASASGVAFTDGTQTKAGVPSLTTIGTEISAAYNLSTGGLALRDQLIPIAGTRAITIPTNATTAFPIGTSIDFYQASGTGANFVAADVTVTILRTPGLTLRTTYSSATLTKVATNTWLLAGDLTA
jgi:hypothetical protein